MKKENGLWIWGVAVIALFFVMACPGKPASADDTAKDTVEGTYPGLATGVLKLARLTDMEKDVLLKAYQIDIKSDFAKESLEQAPPEMRKELGKNLFFLLEQEATERLIQQEAVSMGISPDQPKKMMLKAYVERLTGGLKVNESEIKAFYEINKEMFGSTPFDQVKGSIDAFLLQQKKVEALDTHVEELGKRTDIRVNREWVKAQAQIVRDNPVDKARMSGKPTLVEFWAAGCIPCERMQPILDRLQKKFQSRLNVVFVHVRENQLLGARFGVRATPTQIFFDKEGKEVHRQEGFMTEADIDRVFKQMGVS